MNLTIKKLMDGKNGEWWKGSFPTWVVAILIAVIGFFLQRELKINDDCRKANQKAIAELQVTVESLKVRIGSLETTVQENHELLNEISRRMNVNRRP